MIKIYNKKTNEGLVLISISYFNIAMNSMRTKKLLFTGHEPQHISDHVHSLLCFMKVTICSLL